MLYSDWHLEMHACSSRKEYAYRLPNSTYKIISNLFKGELSHHMNSDGRQRGNNEHNTCQQWKP